MSEQAVTAKEIAKKCEHNYMAAGGGIAIGLPTKLRTLACLACIDNALATLRAERDVARAVIEAARVLLQKTVPIQPTNEWESNLGDSLAHYDRMAGTRG